MDIRLQNIDERLHRDFKAVCAANGTTMRDQLIALMIQHVAKHGDKLNLGEPRVQK